MNVESRNIGLVLSGGGVRGMAHIGLIKALREEGIEAGRVAGTSAGALVGALYAADYSTEDMLKFFREAPLFHYNYFTINKPGFIDTDRYIKLLRAYFPGGTFDSLNRSLYVVATDLLEGEERVFREGPLIRPLLASAALTPVFSPVLIGKKLYADGGILNNFPKEYLEGECDFLIGSNVTSAGKVELKDLRNPLQVTGRVSSLMLYSSHHRKLRQCDIWIEPRELDNIGILDKRRIEKAFEIGYREGKKAIGHYAERLSSGQSHSATPATEDAHSSEGVRDAMSGDRERSTGSGTKGIQLPESARKP